MKFLDQVKSYQSALTRKSKFFSLLMLASGVGLLGAAPFLSYEVSKLECYEKGTVPPKIEEDQMIILKVDLERKDKTIDDLENTVKSKDDVIDDLKKQSNCEDVIKVIENEKIELVKINDGLNTDIKTITKERDDCRSKLKDCENEDDNEANDDEDCGELREQIEILMIDRDDWKFKFENCNKELETGNSNDDCSKLASELEECKANSIKKDDEIQYLKRALALCERHSKIKMAGVFFNSHPFVLNSNEILVTSTYEDGETFIEIERNGKNESQKIKYDNKVSTYTFEDTNLNTTYRITFGEFLRNGIKYTLTTI